MKKYIAYVTFSYYDNVQIEAENRSEANKRVYEMIETDKIYEPDDLPRIDIELEVQMDSSLYDKLNTWLACECENYGTFKDENEAIEAMQEVFKDIDREYIEQIVKDYWNENELYNFD